MTWWKQFELPQLVAHGEAVHHNIATMAQWCAAHDVQLAPHAKTTMAAAVIAAQQEAGAWGLTVATSRQAGVLLDLGVRRVLVANLLVDPAVTAALAARASAAGAEMWCYVDSVAAVELLQRGLTDGQTWSVLLEVGVAGGRTGVRTLSEALAVAAAVDEAPNLRLAGTACFEGVLPAGPDGSASPAVAAFLRRQHEITVALHEAGRFAVDVPVVSAGGSSFFDLVVELLGPTTFAFATQTVLRSGCYVTHDHGLYARTSPFGDRARSGPHLEPALELLASVWSCPEPGVVIAGLGRRDVPFDDRLPVVLEVADRPQDTTGWTVTRLWDQHAYVEVPVGAEVAPGDVLRLGISHPCGAFDRWRSIPVLDADHAVVDVWHPAL